MNKYQIGEQKSLKTKAIRLFAYFHKSQKQANDRVESQSSGNALDSSL